jgi:hypothetical protein
MTKERLNLVEKRLADTIARIRRLEGSHRPNNAEAQRLADHHCPPGQCMSELMPPSEPRHVCEKCEAKDLEIAALKRELAKRSASGRSNAPSDLAAGRRKRRESQRKRKA